MKKLTQLAIISILFSAQTVFACDYPGRIDIPVGATASQDEMVEGMQKIKQFQKEMEVYLTCIVEEEKAARAAIDDLAPEVEQQREEMLNKKYNAAVEDEERLVAQINNEIRDFKTRASND